MATDERPRWHPFLATQERTPGIWTLVDTMGRDYGQVRIVRVESQVGYVAEHSGVLVGRFRTLRAALEATHQASVRSHAPGGATASRYPIHTPHRG
jgi:hypothetical protein